MWQYNYTNYGDELWHHGIKFQKWGVKHGPPYPLSDSKSDAIKSGKSVPESSGGSGSDSESKKTSTPKKASEMTDDELKAATNRLQMESNYNRLYNELYGTKTQQNTQTKKKVGLGKKFVNGVGQVVSNSLKQGATQVGTQWVKYLLGTKVNDHYKTNVINLGNGNNNNNNNDG